MAAEVDNEDGTVNDHNETWSPLPGAARINIATFCPECVSSCAGDGGANVSAGCGWLADAGNFYWSSLAGMSGQHHAADVRTAAKRKNRTIRRLL